MADSYAALADYYDLIMTSGYYDYDAYAQGLLDRLSDAGDVLELGVGTGLVCERLLALGTSGLRITGIDHTESMLTQARRRLDGRVRLVHHDIVDLTLPSGFDVAYSVGGIWYCVRDNGEIRLGSHLVEDDDNVKGLANLVGMLRPGGRLLLAVQEAHRPFQRPLPGGLTYAQDIRAHGDGRFTKDYIIMRDNAVLAHQRSPYRLYCEEQADRLLEHCGFRNTSGAADGLFRQYVRA